MEQATQSQLVMEANVGQHKSPYLSRELDLANEVVKQPLRERVLEHFLKYHPDGPMKCFGLPGERWAFESMLKASWVTGDSEFVAVERDIAVLRRALKWMPRRRRGLQPIWDRHPLTHDGYVDFVETDDSIVLHCDFQDFVRIGRADQHGKSARKRWGKAFRGWTCAWFDFTTMLHPRLEASLGRVSTCMSLDDRTVPVAMTLLAAREQRAVTRRMRLFNDHRVNYVARILAHNRYRTFALDEAVEYVSVGGCPMVLILGRMDLRNAELTNDEFSDEEQCVTV